MYKFSYRSFKKQRCITEKKEELWQKTQETAQKRAHLLWGDKLSVAQIWDRGVTPYKSCKASYFK